MDKTFDEILDDLEFAFMINLQARTGRFGLYTDVTFLGLGDDAEVTVAGVPLGIETSIDFRLCSRALTMRMNPSPRSSPSPCGRGPG